MFKFITGLVFGYIFAGLWMLWRNRQLDRRRAAAARLAAPPPTPDQALRSVEQERDSAQREALTLSATIDRQAIELKELKHQLDRLGSQPAGATAGSAASTAEIDELKNKHAALLRTLDERDKSLAEYKEQLRLARQKADEAAAAAGAQTELIAEMEALKNRLGEIENERDALAKSLDEARRERDVLAQSLQLQKAGQAADAAGSAGDGADPSASERGVTPGEAAGDEPAKAQEVDIDALKASLPPARGKRDNLKKIKGIGEKLERLLNRLGITTFAQIAQLTPQQVEQIASVLKVFPDRMKRDDWVSQAQELVDKAK